MKLREADRVYVVSLLWMAMLMLLPVGTWAAETDLDSKARALDQRVTTREERTAFFTKFGIRTDCDGCAIYGTLPPGQALVLWSLCGTDATCATNAWNAHKDGKGWGKIAKDLGKNVGHAVRQVTDAHRDLAAKAGRESTPRGEGATSSPRPEHPSRGMGRPGR